MQRFVFSSLTAVLLLGAVPAAAERPLVLPSKSSRVVQNDPVATARATLFAREPGLRSVTLSHEATVDVAGGRRVVRFRQHHDGVPVLNRGASLLLDASGRPTRLAAARVLSDPLPRATPVLAVAVAAQIASSVARAHLSPADGKLAWLPTGTSARLVWTFYRPMRGLPLAPALAIDAENGSVLLAHNAVTFDRAATVHEINPVTTPTPVGVTLGALPFGAMTLTTDQLRVQNCVDEGTLTEGKYPFHACVTKQLAWANIEGDFPYIYSSDTAQEDEYAEVAMFYHASKAYAYFTSLGMPALEAAPLELVVNLRLPVGFSSFDWSTMQDPQLPLEPYNNAFFAPQNPFFESFGPNGPGLWFGQGVFTDFAYDGDVVYHEFGHAMVDRTAKLVHYWHLDPQGATVSPGAMNEAIADFFSSAITGDGQVGEYAAQNFVQLGASAIRDLNNDHKCPSQLSGEVHVDSTLFSGALWGIRETLDATGKTAFDTALMTALVTAPTGDLAYEDMAALMRTSIAASTLGESVASALDDELTDRGVLPACSRILEYTGKPILGPDPRLQYSFTSPGTYSVPLEGYTPFVPGLMQIHVALEPDTVEVRVSLQDVYTGQQQWSEGDPYEPAVLARFDATPIEFSYDSSVASSNAGEPIELGAMRYAKIAVPAGATELYLMIVNLGDLDGHYTSISVTQQAAPKNTGGSSGVSGSAGTAGTAGSGGTTQAEADDLAPAGGCACQTPAAPSGGASLWLAALALLGLRRRR